MSALRSALPAPVLALARWASPRSNRFVGPVQNWDRAVGLAQGYADPNLSLQIIAAARLAAADPALSDRDGLVRPHIPPPSWLTDILREPAAGSSGPQVIDIGGALGNTWRTCRAVLLPGTRWQVVELPAIAEAGNAEFAAQELSFSDVLPSRGPVDVVLLMSSLQYFPDPDALLSQIAALAPRWIVVERTPIISGLLHRVTVQRVPPALHLASYPMWLLARARLISQLPGYAVIRDEPSEEGLALTSRLKPFVFRTLVLRRKDDH